MTHFVFRNVNSAFDGMVALFATRPENRIHNDVAISKTQSRNGPVLQIMEPVILTYEKPTERVLFNQARDANPFLHVFESLWMLAGRNDVAPLAYYAPNMANYSDDGVTLNGAYGYRWKHSNLQGVGPGNVPGSEGYDQLKIVINHLKQKPESRRAVLHMSNVEDDLLKMDTTKDQCCNLCCCFSIRNVLEECEPISIISGSKFTKGREIQQIGRRVKYLDMTVFNRSNDLVWGCLGANYVHFSFLQEYMAANIGVEVGVYNQVSNNLHIYTQNNSGFKHEEWLADETPMYYTFPNDNSQLSLKQIPLIQDPAAFEVELPKFVEAAAQHKFDINWSEPFLQSVATPLLWAFEHHKRRNYASAFDAIKLCQADDWKIAATNWLMKRKVNYEAKEVERNVAL